MTADDAARDRRFKELIKENHIHQGRWWAVLIVSVLIVVGIPIGGVRWTAYVSCRDSNDLRSEIVAGWDNTLLRANAAAKASLASPLVSEQVKATTRRNLRGLKGFVDEQDRRLAQRAC